MHPGFTCCPGYASSHYRFLYHRKEKKWFTARLQSYPGVVSKLARLLLKRGIGVKPGNIIM